MKKIFYVIPLALTIASGMVLTACGTQETSNEKEHGSTEISNKKDNPTTNNAENDGSVAKDEEAKRMERIEKGIMIYGESVKGSDYLTTVTGAQYNNDKSKQGIVTAVINVKNVREDGQAVNLSEMNFNLEDKSASKSYKGTVISPEDNFYKLSANEALTFEVDFKIPHLSKGFMLHIKSKVDPIDAAWKINNLESVEEKDA